VAVVPTLVLLAGFICSLRPTIHLVRRRPPTTKSAGVIAFLGMCVLCSFAGYLAFIIAYPSDTGDTIKATYMLQTFPPLAILGAVFLTRMHDRHRRAFWILATLVLLAAAHGSYAFFTRYI